MDPVGGMHAYFAGSDQHCGRLPSHHLDFRATGGYILAPPSQVGGKPCALGTGEDAIQRLVRGDARTVSPQLRDAVADLYDAWWDKRAPERTRAERAAPPEPATRDAVTVPAGEVKTLISALVIAADYKRDRAELCADCADQSCPDCGWRLRDAHAYDRAHVQLLQSAETSAAASE
jgi:hypothetical protein